MTTATVDDAISRLPDLIDAAIRGEEVFITAGGGRTTKLVAVTRPEARRQFGSAKGRIAIADDFEDPLADFAEYR